MRERLGIVSRRQDVLPGENLDRGMIARILASLFALGAVILLATLLLPDSPSRQTAELAGIAGAALVIALVLIAGYDRVPLVVLRLTPLAGTLLVGLIIYYSDPAYATTYAMYLAWVLVAASLFLEARLILLHGLLAVGVYVAALLVGDYTDSELAVGVTMMTGTVFATAIVMGGVGRHIHAVMGTLHSAAQTDPLTGLPNRRALDAAFARELARSQRSGRPLGVVIVDLDGFKRFNDQRGHQEGDRALQRLGLVIADKTRVGDVAARIGGEEFALLVADCDTPGALVLAERLRRGVEVEFGGDGGLTASCGVASFPVHGDSPSELIAAADGALYEAKRRGRNRVVAAGEERPELRVLEGESEAG